MSAFQPWPKIPRLRRGVLITEKLDGTNACVAIEPFDPDCENQANFGTIVEVDGQSATLLAQSRNRFIVPGKQDNAGFAGWAQQHAETLAAGLGFGHHFGEWWGVGVQRGYGLIERRFSLFNTKRWQALSFTAHHHCAGIPDDFGGLHDVGVRVVPVLASGPFDSATVDHAIERLREGGSVAAPGFMRPEGVVVFHLQAQSMFKVLLENDDIPKGAVA